jgi:hypothetical protein
MLASPMPPAAPRATVPARTPVTNSRLRKESASARDGKWIEMA